MMDSHSGYAISRIDGSALFYELTTPPGEVAGTLILCDGIGCDGYVWRHLRRDFGDRYRIIHWHYRGHGRSPYPRDPSRLSMQDLAEDLEAVLDDAGIDGGVVCGHSMGVQVALEAYRRAPERVHGLGLFCGAAEHTVDSPTTRALADVVVPNLRKILGKVPWLYRGVARRVLPTKLAFAIATRVEINGNLLRAEDFMPYLHHMARIDPRIFLDMLLMASEHSATDLLAYIDVPTLVLAGRLDGFTPVERSLNMHEAIAGAELIVIEDGSHTAPIERPDIAHDYLAQLLLRVGDHSRSVRP